MLVEIGRVPLSTQVFRLAFSTKRGSRDAHSPTEVLASHDLGGVAPELLGDRRLQIKGPWNRPRPIDSRVYADYEISHVNAPSRPRYCAC